MRYAIGDIHGCIKTLEELVKIIMQTDNDPTFFFVGDYIDRGPNPKAVIDFIINLKKNGIKIHCIKGNHEEMMLDAYYQNSDFYLLSWYYNGAESTIMSFNPKFNSTIKLKEVIPEYYIEIIKEMPYFIELDDYFIVHAGFNFMSGNPFDDFQSMLWTRAETNVNKYTKGKTIIHGHTPVPIEIVKENINNKNPEIINIDTGCVYNYLENLGILTALNLDTLELIYVRKLDP